MLVVHHLGISQSDRIVWLCEELEIPYKLEIYKRDPVTRLAPASYRSLTPFGTAPVIADGELIMGESAAIIEYIANVHGAGRLMMKPGDVDYAAFLFWFHFANGSLMPSAMIDMLVNEIEEPSGIALALRSRLDRAYAQVEVRLGETPYLAGQDFTAADILTLFPLTTMRLFAPKSLADFPNIRAYLQRIAARPAFARAMQKADPGLVIPLE